MWRSACILASHKCCIIRSSLLLLMVLACCFELAAENGASFISVFSFYPVWSARVVEQFFLVSRKTWLCVSEPDWFDTRWGSTISLSTLSRYFGAILIWAKSPKLGQRNKMSAGLYFQIILKWLQVLAVLCRQNHLWTCFHSAIASLAMRWIQGPTPSVRANNMAILDYQFLICRIVDICRHEITE
jgi:hypothetical protein